MGTMLLLGLLGCTCNQGDDSTGPAPEVALALEGIEGTFLEADNDFLPTLTLDGAEMPDADVGDGVQVLQIAPVGTERQSQQAAVVFDRPMVALTDLDSMNQSAPLNCAPEIPGRRRWAGTSTAVLVPEAGAFPRGTAFRCAVPAGTPAIDGVTLEKELSWTFETPRPRVVEMWPHDGSVGIDLQDPVRMTFDQPVELTAVKPHLQVTAVGQSVAFTLDRPDPAATSESALSQVLVRFPRTADTTYGITVAPGVVGREGPLPGTEDFAAAFETYPPLKVVLDRPEGQANVSPGERLRLEFTTPVTLADVAQHLTIVPKPEGWSPPEGEWDTRYWSYAPIFAPRTTYSVSLAAGLQDVHGQPLTGPAEWTFTTGDYDPWLSVPRGFKLVAANNPPELPYKHLNASKVDIAVASLPRDAFTTPKRWHGGVTSHLAASADRRVGAGVKTTNLTTLGQTPLSDLLSPGGFGWIATSFSAPNVRSSYDNELITYSGLMVVTDLGGTLKVGPGATDVWVTSLSEGTPVAGVEVEVYRGAERIGSAKTDADGLARVSGVPGPGWERWEDEIWAMLTSGEDRSLVRMQWNDGLSPYNFNVWGGFEVSGRTASSHGFTDRGVYRPGDPVFARATFRFKEAKGLTIPKGEITWTLTDPRGEEVTTGTGALDARGGFALQTALPEDGALGDYGLRIAAAGQGWSKTEYLSVMARSYRAPAFRVQVSGPTSAQMDQPIEAVVDARYLFGASLKSGEVRWRSWTESASFTPDGYDGFSFGPEYDWWSEDDYRGGNDLLGDAVVPLVDGRATYTQTVPAPEDAQEPVTLFLEAEVEDVDRQSIASRAEVLVHPGAYYVGARSKARMTTAGEVTEVEVVAVDHDGTAVKGRDLKVELIKRTWDSVRERGMDGQWRWVTNTSDTSVQTASATSGAAPVSVTLIPADAGYHLVRVTSTDDSGRELVGVDSMYVTGSGYVSWGRSDDNKLELVPDKSRHAPGETAKILVKTPYEGMRALVTVEREGVLARQVVTLAGTSDTVEIPIEAAYRPNVFVSVVATQGAGPQDAPDKGRPEVFMGLIELDVDSEEEHLEVDVKPVSTLYRPRDEVTVEVTVARAGGAVRGAGVSLYAVDEAILSLTDYQTPDPHGTFYSHRSLSVLTADGRVAALDRAPFLTKGAKRGGDGGDGGDTGPETRSKFLTTITWQPDLETDDQGKVVATFELPDNLTTFRIMAVADAGATGFGSADEEIRVSRPLIVRPALPRTLRAGDEAFAGVVVHNDFVRERLVRVEAEVTGPLTLTGAPVSLRIPAKTSVEVPFTLNALEQGEAVFTFRAVAGPDRDAITWTLPIGRDVILETTASSGTVDDGKTLTEQIGRPDDASTAFGGLALDVSTTALVGSGAGLDYLVEYPHGCIEQKTSRALASLVALPVRERAGIEVPEATLKANVEGILRELDGFRATRSDGLAYWPGGRYGSVLGTTYAVELMGRAKEAGFDVDAKLLGDSVGYLRAQSTRNDYADKPLVVLSTRALIASAIARAGQGDAGLNQRLYGSRRDLSVFAVSRLLEAIVRTTGTDSRTRELEKIIASRTTIEAAAASVKENDGGTWARMWASDDLSTAAALEALMVANPEHPLGPKYALHLASSRKTGHWANTRATAAALAALSRYAAAREGTGDPIDASLSLAGQPLLAEAVALPGSSHMDLALSEVTNGPLVVGAEGGMLYYMARLSYAPKQLVPRDEGFTLARAFEIVDGAGGREQVSAGALVRVTLTVVTPVVRHDVAVIDRIPAGLEPMDGSFATTSQAPVAAPPAEAGTRELPQYGGSWVFDHHEIDDAEVRLYADYMPPGVHTFRYMARATTPGTFDHPAAVVEEMYEPENFGRTAGGTFVVGAAPVAGR